MSKEAGNPPTREGSISQSSMLGLFLHFLAASRVSIQENTQLRKRFALSLLLMVSLFLLLATGSDYAVRRLSQSQQSAAASRLASRISGFFLRHCDDAANLAAHFLETGSLLSGGEGGDSARLHEELGRARGILGLSMIYILDRQGAVVGTSSLPGGRTTAGTTRFPPSILDDLKATSSHCVCPGVLSGERWLFFSEPFFAAGGAERLGWVIIQVSLDYVDAHVMSMEGYDAVLLSPEGVVFSTTRADWLYQAALPLDEERRAALIAARKFGDRPLDSMPFRLDGSDFRHSGVRYSVRSESIDLPGWRIAIVRPLPYPLALMFISGLVGAMAGFPVSYTHLRRRRC